MFRVTCATVDEAPAAAAILREVAEWLEATGQKNWEPEWFTPESMVANVERGELWLAWEGTDPVGTMLVVATDEDFWPEDRPGDALYEAAGFQRVDERTIYGWLHVVRYEKSVVRAYFTNRTAAP